MLLENLGKTCGGGAIGNVMVKSSSYREILAWLNMVSNNAGLSGDVTC